MSIPLYILLLWISSLPVVLLMPGGNMPMMRCPGTGNTAPKYISSQANGMNGSLSSGDLGDMEPLKFSVERGQYIVLHVLHLQDGDMIRIFEECRMCNRIGSEDSNGATELLVIGKRGCSLGVRAKLMDTSRCIIKYTFSRDCPLLTWLSEELMPVELSCTGISCSCLSIRAGEGQSINISITNPHLHCNEEGNRCRFFIQIMQENGNGPDMNITRETTGLQFMNGVSITLKSDQSEDSGSSDADVSFDITAVHTPTTTSTETSRTAAITTKTTTPSQTAISPTTATTTQRTSQEASILTPATTVQQSSQDVPTPTTSAQQASQEEQLSAPQSLIALWIALVALFVLLVVALVAFIVLRNRMNPSSVDKVDPLARVGTRTGARSNHLRGNGVVQNPVYNPSGFTVNETEGDVYNTAYQSADDPGSSTGLDTEKLAHEYAYADTNGPSFLGDSDLDKGQVYNVAYQSVDDSYNKPATHLGGSNVVQRGSPNGGNPRSENGPQNDSTYQSVDDEYSTTPELKQIDDHDYVTLERDRPGSVTESTDQ